MKSVNPWTALCRSSVNNPPTPLVGFADDMYHIHSYYQASARYEPGHIDPTRLYPVYLQRVVRMSTRTSW